MIKKSKGEIAANIILMAGHILIDLIFVVAAIYALITGEQISF